MAFANNVLIVRRVLMARLVNLWNQDQLVEKIDRLPIELTPRNAKVRGRCCRSTSFCRKSPLSAAEAERLTEPYRVQFPR